MIIDEICDCRFVLNYDDLKFLFRWKTRRNFGGEKNKGAERFFHPTAATHKYVYDFRLRNENLWGQRRRRMDT